MCIFVNILSVPSIAYDFSAHSSHFVIIPGELGLYSRKQKLKFRRSLMSISILSSPIPSQTQK